jgi:predicted aspartyl protease
MNNSRVVSSRFPYLPLRLTIEDYSSDLEALLDTGFDGDVVIPENYAISHLAPVDSISANLADGSAVDVPAYVGSARIGINVIEPILILVLGDVPLIGRNLIKHFAVILDHGRQVIIEP